jgi:hypothetical protein
MKKVFICLFFFCSIVCYSQTWTWTEAVVVIGNTTLERENSVITQEQYNRLLQQYEETYDYVNMAYIDVLEMGSGPRVLSGRRPVFNGYYYLLIKEQSLVGGVVMILAYGHPNTGRMEIKFNQHGGTSINSKEYTDQYNKFIRWANGE